LEKMMRAGAIAVVAIQLLWLGIAAARIDAVSVSTAASVESPPDGSGGFAGSSGEFLPSDGSSLEARLRFNVNADVNTGQAREESSALNFALKFTVDEPGPYRLTVEAAVLSEVTRHADSPGCSASVAFSGVFGSATGLAVKSGALGFGSSLVLPDGNSEAAQEYRGAAHATLIGVPGTGAPTKALIYDIGATAISRGCEVAVRGGLDNGTTSDCSACGYPGAPPRDAAEDGIAVRITVALLCGDGVTDPEVGEQCDLGARNGTEQGCCSAQCTLRDSGTTCIADDNPCTGDICNGTDAECATPPQAGGCDDGLFCNGADQCAGGACSDHAGSPCPEADGDADCRESCDEGRDACDALDPAGSVCHADENVCTDDSCDAQGSCVAIERSGECDDGDACTTGDQCLDGVCRAAGPLCDACQSCSAGSCGGVSCTPSPTATALPTATATADPACAGDCSGDGTVTVSEIVTLVGVALGSTESSACGRGDLDGDGAIRIAELVAAVNALLDGCA
jgi:hypothetical protein